MDDYCDKRSLAAYFEAQWLDKIREMGDSTLLNSASRTIPDNFVQSPFYLQVCDFIHSCIAQTGSSPRSFLEVGPALGRVSYELSRSYPSLEEGWVVEPSHRLMTHFRRLLLNAEGYYFPFIESLHRQGSIHLNTAPLVRDCQHVSFHCIESRYDHNSIPTPVDITICLNVIDQCESPSLIVDALKEDTRHGGIVFLANTYQWQKKHLKEASEAVNDINQYFTEDGWQPLEEAEIPYHFRFNERFSKLFLSHVVAYRKR
ncbi:hypothetical protein ABT56_01610 [Photobacterium aquae]|uniref:SAM-dependent methyltransferase n=1 Tax=Photobacterium aquae TaxID=1195763 RepID=A0A0J1HB97_9GAMM|nr:hypothetical protein [Photobacterium aquae]KLV08930.1 hypothetical protein ABT56_01610 [Photobacterium aquae]